MYGGSGGDSVWYTISEALLLLSGVLPSLLILIYIYKNFIYLQKWKYIQCLNIFLKNKNIYNKILWCACCLKKFFIWMFKFFIFMKKI